MQLEATQWSVEWNSSKILGFSSFIILFNLIPFSVIKVNTSIALAENDAVDYLQI